MKKTTKSTLGKLALILGGAAVLDGVAGSGSRSAIANPSGSSQTPLLTAKKLKELISSDEELQAVLRSMFPNTSVQDVVTNINNSFTLNGVSFSKYGNSILRNSAFEYGLQGFEGQTNVNIDSKVDGYNIINVLGSATSSNKELIDLNFLHVIEVFAKTDSTNSNIGLKSFNDLDVNINKTNGTTTTVSVPLTTSADFVLNRHYVGNVGTLVSNLANGVVKVSLWLYKGNGTFLKIKKASVRPVSLGESVPSNLPWLPAGQEVKDPTTGDRGIYNGTTVDWYTMV